jgi:HAD superfamily hydrolase (TIGR01459 family)
LLLKSAKKLQLPMLCLNPDLEVVKISGERFPCAGVIAQNYLKIGGKVTMFGKPHQQIYEHCHKLLGKINKQKILAIGDGLETDILGARDFGIDCALVTGGILRGKTIAEIEEICVALAVRPSYIIPKFA